LPEPASSAGRFSCTGDEEEELVAGKFVMRWKELLMNQEQISGNWKVIKGKMKEQWGKLTDDDFRILEGHTDQLMGTLQRRYGIQKEEAERQIRDFEQKNADLMRQ
jgi:uncharacterized protein YjbJ (UPF0337 family)